MRALKWVSALTILALLFAVLPATMAEDDIIIDMEEAVDEEFVVDLDALDDSSIALESDTLDLDGLEDNLLISEEGEYTEVSPVSNASGDFEIDEDGLLIRYRGFARNVVIPDGVKGIGGGAFENADFIESASIPSSVTYIGYRAFSGCASLKSIILPDGVTDIEKGAFQYCDSLESVTIPSSVTMIDREAFSGSKRRAASSPSRQHQDRPIRPDQALSRPKI